MNRNCQLFKTVSRQGLVLGLIGLFFTGMPLLADDSESLSVSQIMQSIITPMTNKIWGTSDIQADEQWLELENAAITLIAAGQLLETSNPYASNPAWQEQNKQMLQASREVLEAIKNKDEEALFNAANDKLYPPCESCHEQFEPQ